MHHIISKDEHIIMKLRKHYIIYLFIFFLFIFLNIVPVALFIVIFNIFFREVPDFVWWFIWWYQLFIITFLYIKFIEEVLDMIIITDKRIIDIDQVTFLQRNVSTAKLTDIQDARGKVNGFFGTVLGYGTLIVQTASTKSFFTMDFVYDPAMKAENIIKLTGKYKSRSSHDHFKSKEKEESPIDLLIESRQNISSSLNNE